MVGGLFQHKTFRVLFPPVFQGYKVGGGRQASRVEVDLRLSLVLSFQNHLTLWIV